MAQGIATEQVTRVDPRAYVDPLSVLVRTALDIIAAHGGEEEDGQPATVCASCGELTPCAPVRHATYVVLAAGVPIPARARPSASPEKPEESRLPEESRSSEESTVRLVKEPVVGSESESDQAEADADSGTRAVA